jgi:hypothetical protein
VLAEILGAQIAWWQLGFAARRGVLRAARRGVRFPDPDVWQVAVGIAIRTVNRHLENIRTKLGHRRRSELVRIARGHG